MSEKKPKPKKRSARRDWPTEGDIDINVLYASVGRFISQWERYEAVLSLLFSVFVSDSESKGARRAYASVRTFEGRSDMLRASSEAYFAEHPNQERQDAFKLIIADAKDFSACRNDVAHGVVDYYFPENFPLLSEPIALNHTYCLYPSFASFKERDLANMPSYCYASAELNYFCGEFIRLGKEAFDLYKHLSNYEPPASL